METVCFLILTHLTIDTFDRSQANCQQVLHTLLCLLPGMSPVCNMPGFQLVNSGGWGPRCLVGTQTSSGWLQDQVPWLYRAAVWLQRQSGGVFCCCVELHQDEGRKSWVAGKKRKWKWSDCKLTLNLLHLLFLCRCTHTVTPGTAPPLGKEGLCQGVHILITHSGSCVVASTSTWHLSPSTCLPGLILIPASN